MLGELASWVIRHIGTSELINTRSYYRKETAAGATNTSIRSKNVIYSREPALIKRSSFVKLPSVKVQKNS